MAIVTKRPSKGYGMGLLGHCAMGLATKPMAPQVPLVVLLLAAEILDIFAVAFGWAGIEGMTGNPWSHGLFMSLVWSVAAGLVFAYVYRSYRAGTFVGLLVFSHWVLDFISHPIPFASFSWRTWQWSYGHPLPPDLPLFFAGSPKVGLGLYNSISAIQATVLEAVMLLLGAAVYVTYVLKKKAAS